MPTEETPKIEETPKEARQGDRDKDIFVILAISTVLAAALLWGIFTVFAADSPDETGAVQPDEAALQADDPEVVNPAATEG